MARTNKPKEMIDVAMNRPLSKLAHDDLMPGNLGTGAQNLSVLNETGNSSMKLTSQIPSGVEFGKGSNIRNLMKSIAILCRQ